MSKYAELVKIAEHIPVTLGSPTSPLPSCIWSRESCHRSGKTDALGVHWFKIIIKQFYLLPNVMPPTVDLICILKNINTNIVRGIRTTNEAI